MRLKFSQPGHLGVFGHFRHIDAQSGLEPLAQGGVGELVDFLCDRIEAAPHTAASANAPPRIGTPGSGPAKLGTTASIGDFAFGGGGSAAESWAAAAESWAAARELGGGGAELGGGGPAAALAGPRRRRGRPGRQRQHHRVVWRKLPDARAASAAVASTRMSAGACSEMALSP